MPKEAKFKFANYDGGLPAHPHPEPEGLLTLFSDKEAWRLNWGWSGKSTQGELARYAFDVQATGPASCRVVMREIADTSLTASFELPNNPAADLEAALEERESGIARDQAQIASASPTPAPSVKPVSFGCAHYRGGHPWLGRKRSGNLQFTALEIGLGTLTPTFAVLQLADVASVEVTGRQVAKTKVGAEILFGVLGGLGAREARNQATITVSTKDGQIAHYRVDKKNVAEVRAAITPILEAAGIPLRDEAIAPAQQEALPAAVGQSTPAPPVGTTPSLVDELTKLVQFHDAGALSDEEFTALKAKLIAS
jgi:hypothetical protein